MNNRIAFTLAEVLITLAIIGIVAAMTIPTLISTYKKHTVETKLKRFYSTMSQAVKLSEIDNGEVSSWDSIDAETIRMDDGSYAGEISNVYEWYNKYFAPYIKTVKVEKLENDHDGQILIYFADGSMAGVGSTAWTYYPNAKDYTRTLNETTKYYDRDRTLCGKKYFTLYFNPKSNSTFHKGKGVEPYAVQWDGNIETLVTNNRLGCKENATVERAYCTKLIQINGWKIPDNYFYKF